MSYIVETWELHDMVEKLVSINSRVFENRDIYSEQDFEIISKEIDAAYKALRTIEVYI